MLSFGVKSDIDKVVAALGKMAESQIPFATSKALNGTAAIARDHLREQMSTIFDRPVPYTLNSLFIVPSTKRNLVVRIEHKEFAGKGTPASKYLRPEIEGGARGQKRSERQLLALAGMSNGYYVPGPGAQLDAYGNVRASLIVQIMSSVGAFSESGYMANRTKASAARARGRQRTFFVMRPGNARGLKPGVYERIGRKVRIRGRRGNKRAEQLGGKIIPILFFVRNVGYTKRYDMEGIVGRVVNATFAGQFIAAMDYALATAFRPTEEFGAIRPAK